MKAFVVYHAASTMETKVYKTKAAAVKLAAKLNKVAGKVEYAVATESHYRSSVVHMVERTNLMSGGKYMEASNTPGYMSPASEAYWSM